MTALEIAAIKNKTEVACLIIEIIYSMSENMEQTSDIINCRDAVTGIVLDCIFLRERLTKQGYDEFVVTFEAKNTPFQGFASSWANDAA